MVQELLETGEGIETSKPVEADRGLREGDCIYPPLPHNGNNGGHILQPTNLNDNNQVENWAVVAFYGNRVMLLAYGMPLRGAVVGVCPELPMYQHPRTQGKCMYPLIQTQVLCMSRERCTIDQPAMSITIMMWTWGIHTWSTVGDLSGYQMCVL